MLSERIALPSLISRVNQPGLSCKGNAAVTAGKHKTGIRIQYDPTDLCKSCGMGGSKKFKRADHAYCEPGCCSIPPESTGNDLNKVLLDVMMKQQKGQLHAIVLEALNYEARKSNEVDPSPTLALKLQRRRKGRA